MESFQEKPPLTGELQDPIIVRVASAADTKYTLLILAEMDASAKARGSGIGRRSEAAICSKMESGDAVIALTAAGNWVGFCYIETWQEARFVSNSGMIVNPLYRRQGVATRIKQVVFEVCRSRYPAACIFSITTGLAIMKLNTRLGFEPVTYSEITTDPLFWQKCRHCVNYDTLQSKSCKNCFCTAMRFDPCNQPGPATGQPGSAP